MAANSFADKVAEWEHLIGSMAAHLEEMPQVTGHHAALADLLAEIKAIDREQDLHRARLRDATKRRRETMLRGIDLRNRLVAAAQSHLGVTNPMLVELGIPPRERRKKKRGEEPPANGEAAAKTGA